MSHVVDASNIVSLTGSSLAFTKKYNLFRTDFVSYQLNYSDGTGGAMSFASATDVTHAVQSTATLTVSDYSNIAAGATITINGTVYTNGTDWSNATGNTATATSIAAIATLPAGITASSTNAVVTFTNTAYGTVGNSNTISSSDAVRLTITASPWSNGVEATLHKSPNTLVQGEKVLASTSTTLPTGLTATNYWVIHVNATTIQLATSLANANAGTAVEFTDNGTGNQIFTPVSLSQVVKLQQSNDGVTFFDVSGLTVTVTGASNTLWLVTNPPTLWHQIVVTPTSGLLTLAVVVCNRNNSIVGG